MLQNGVPNPYVPVNMVRKMRQVVIILLHSLAVGLASEVSNTSDSTQCIRAPPHAQPADDHYRLGVAGDPDLFLPGELYTVTLEGVDSGSGPTPFIGFTIWAELVGVSNHTENQTLGTFQTYAAQAIVREACSPSVVNSTAHQKIEIQVIWSPPATATDMCVRLCARAGPAVAGTDSWSILARKICAAPTAPASFARHPPIVEPCCACDEAKYEVTFEGHWSRNTHPRDFPQESNRAHFGDVIGASHTAQYRVWQEGRVASGGLRRLADDGATTALEKELKAESDHIRTIIKARGISWQQVAVGGNPSTFAVFRVDAKNHLVSLAAKLAPSPDWIVGVSALELCNKNCTWTSSMTLPLYPYDAGTDSGISYTSRRHPTTPAAPVRALRPDWPKNEKSPFYNDNGDMRPFARLKLNRLRLYEKACDGAEEPSLESDLNSGSAAGSCSTHAWGAWAACSVTCGRGRQARQRRYIWPARALADACRAPLTDYRTCYGPRRHCRAPSDYEPDPAESTGPCAVSQWSNWSRCEGCGVRFRERRYLVPRAHKHCHIGLRASAVMHQAMPCEAGPCDTPADLMNSTNFDWWFVQDNTNAACPVTAWGAWSPCSARCGPGRRVRTRLYLSRRTDVQHEVVRRLFDHWMSKYTEEADFIKRTGPSVPEREVTTPSVLQTGSPETTTQESELEIAIQDLLERCKHTLSVQESLCDGEGVFCPPSEGTCKQPMVTGPCRRYAERWFFDHPKQKCEPFGYSGCGGNDNNFRTLEDCEKTCMAENSTLVVMDFAGPV